jgi:Family of unknown function (DUF6941)
VRFEFVLLADATNESGGKLNILGAGISRLTPAALPSMLPQLALVVRAQLDDEDFERPHRINVEFLAPNGEQVMPPLEMTVAPEQLRPVRDALLEGETSAAQFTLGMQGLQFTEEGPYEFVVRLDDEEVARYPIVVAVTPPAR